MRYAEACEWLQLDPTTELNQKAIKKAFHTAAIREHPDKSDRTDAKQRFQNVTYSNSYLLECVARGETGLNAYEQDDEKEEEDDFFYDDDDFDFDPRMFYFFSDRNGNVFVGVHAHPPTRPAQPPPPNHPANLHHQNEKYVPTPEDIQRHKDEEQVRLEKRRCHEEERDKQSERKYDEFVESKKKEKERDYDDFMERMYTHAKEKEEARKQQKKRQEEHTKQANNQDRQQQRKDTAPLLFELAKVTGTADNELNGKKVRVIDFHNGMYVVELDAAIGGGGGKRTTKTKAKRKARIKPEHLSPLTGTKPKTNQTTTSQVAKDETTQPGTVNKLNNASSVPPKKEPKWMKIKVQCPKDKKPGDTFEIVNKHDPRGNKVVVTVPANAQSKKSFPWMVPVAEEREINSVCAACSSNLNTVEQTTQPIALRSCPHSVCCQLCLRQIQGKCCLVCSKPNPTTESMQHLPYLKELHAPASVLEKILEEYLCSCEFDATKGTDDVRKVGDILDLAAEQTEKEIKKHYRRMSLKCHPDRHGEEFRSQFEVLTKARDVMIQAEMRRDYVVQMLDIICKVHLRYLPKGHEYWIEKHEAEINKETQNKKKEVGKKEKRLQLEGGLLYDVPRKPRVSIWNDEDRLIKLCLPVKDEYQFRSYCDEVVIVGSCDSMEEEQMRLGQVSKEAFCIEGGEIIIKLYLPEHGIWEIKWCMKVDQGEGNIFQSKFSEESTIDLRSKSQIALLDNLASLKESARLRVTSIQVMNRKYKKTQSNSIGRQETEAKYWEMHSLIANGRSIERRLRSIYKRSKQTPTSELSSLKEVLDDVAKEKAKLEEVCEFYINKDAKKIFKVEVAGILETSKALDWIEHVSREDLDTMRGEVNRLYQLLIEGKQANSLTLDCPTLMAASKRSDLFSSKQCDILRVRGDEVEVQSIAASNAAVAEARKAEEEKKERLEIEAMGTLMPRNTIVKIYGLTSQNELNGSIATFIGIAPNKRFSIRLFSGKEISLKKENFSKWDESQFGGKQAAIKVTSLDTSTTSTVDTQIPELESQMEASKQQLDMKKRVASPVVEAYDRKSSGTAFKSKSKQNQYGKLGLEYSQDYAIQKQLTPITESKPIVKPLHSQKQESIVVKSKVKANESQGNNNTPKSKKGKRCRKGITCHFLRKGPKVCRFIHSQEEISQVHPIQNPAQHPRDVTVSVHNEVFKHEEVSKQLEPQTSSRLFSCEENNTVPSLEGVPVHNEIFKHEKVSEQLEPQTSLRLLSCEGNNPPPSLEGVPNEVFKHEEVSKQLEPRTSSRLLSCEVHNTPPSGELLVFILQQKTCFKCEAKTFYNWLKSEDILSLSDLGDAIEDDDYFNSKILKNGLKKFKTANFKKLVHATILQKMG